nr:MAG TPA: hypothetical protein [Herelleviridae sp.]
MTNWFAKFASIVPEGVIHPLLVPAKLSKLYCNSVTLLLPAL